MKCSNCEKPATIVDSFGFPRCAKCAKQKEKENLEQYALDYF